MEQDTKEGLLTVGSACTMARRIYHRTSLKTGRDGRQRCRLRTDEIHDKR
jgi:hypothetical protein